MKMYVKPSIEVIELQLKENIAAVPTTVYKGKKNSMAYDASSSGNKALKAADTGLDKQSYQDQYGFSVV